MTTIKSLIDADPSWFVPSNHDDMQPDGYLSTSHLRSLLIAPFAEIDNPTPATQIPAILTDAGMESAAPNAMGTISAPIFIEIGSRIRAQDREGLVAIAKYLNIGRDGQPPVLSDVEKAAVTAYLQQTIPDPTWPAKVHVSKLQQAGLGDDVTLDEINTALGRPAGYDNPAETARVDALNAAAKESQQ